MVRWLGSLIIEHCLSAAYSVNSFWCPSSVCRLDLCKRVHCEHGARCEDGICVCPTNCPSLMESVDLSPDGDAGICANDGRTYLTECHMQRAACDHGLSLQVLHKGPCPTPPADLILAASDYHDSSSSLASHPNALARKCHCNKHGNVYSSVSILLFLSLSYYTISGR